MIPLRILIYYGWPSGYNAHWNNNKVAEDMARNDLIVLGDGLQDPSHGDHSNTQAIIDKIKALRPTVKIFGYVDTAQAYSTFMAKVLQWNGMGIHGIFFDKAGYDYGSATTNGRVAVNQKVDLVHSLGLLAFVNAWNQDHVLGVANDASYPNSTFNPDLITSNLQAADWSLIESLAVNDDSYQGGFEPQAQYVDRMDKVAQYQDHIRFAGVGIIGAENAAKFAFLWTAGIMGRMAAVGNADSNYGASSGTTRWYSKPDNWAWGNYLTNSDIVVSPDNSAILRRFLSTGDVRFSLDWSTTPPSSEIARL